MPVDPEGLQKVQVFVADAIPGTGATNLGKAEDAAHTSGDVGVLGLAVRNDSLAALAGTDLDYTPHATNSRGSGSVSIVRWSDSARMDVSMADAFSNGSIIGLMVQAFPMDFDGGTAHDRHRNNTDTTLLASAARTTTQTSADITTYNASQLIVTLDMTAVGTGSVTVTINGKDAASGKYSLLLSGAAVTTNSTNVYRVGIGNTVTANVSANLALPRTIQIVVTANNANSATYSVGYALSV